MIVVDTSAWIEFLRATESRADNTLVRLIEEDVELAVTEVVVAELLAGARTEAHHESLREQVLAFPVLSLGGLDGFEAAAEVFRACRRDGRTPRGIADCLVAAPAIAAGAPLLHADADFDRMARCTALEVHPLDRP